MALGKKTGGPKHGKQMLVLDNQRHERFAQAVAAGKSGTEAYLEAGYSGTGNSAESAASRLLRNVQVQARVAELQSRVATGIVLTRQWVIERLIENANRAMQAEAVTVGGEATGEYRYDGSVANRALELLGKELGMFVERQEIDQNTRIITDEPLTDDQWEHRYAGGPMPASKAN